MSSAMIVVAILARTSEWWRGIYAITLLTLFFGSSHIEALATVGSYAKVGGVGLLALATLVTTRGLPTCFHSVLHRLLVGLLWLTVTLALASTIWSQARLVTLTEAVALAALVYVLHRVSVTRWREREVMIGDLETGFWATVVLLAVGLAMGVMGADGAVSSLTGRWQGFLNNPNLTGMTAAVTTMLGIGIALERRSHLVRFATLIPAIAVILSQSRTSLTSVVVALVWVTTVRGSLVMKMVGGAVATGALVAWMVLPDSLGGLVLGRFGSFEGGDAFSGRTVVWREVIVSVRENALGVGWATTPIVMNSSYDSGLSESSVLSVHGAYLQMVYELGWVAIPLALSFPLLFLTGALIASTDGIGTGLVGVIIVGVITNLMESPMFGVGQPFPYLFWFAVIGATAFPLGKGLARSSPC